MNPTAAHLAEADALAAELREKVAACMQCGTCSASCPNAHAMDLTPRQMWRRLILGLTDEVLNSRTFWLCSACYTCTLRCPRGLPLTETIGGLKRLAAMREERRQQKHAAFYQAFMNNVRTWGRVQEMDLMLHYFAAMRDPLLPLGFTSLGVKLLAKGKLRLPDKSHKGHLQAIFDKARELEEGRS